MAGWDDVGATLPASHVFFTIARGRNQKTFVFPRWAVAAATASMGLAGLWLIGCTVYVAGHDTLVAALMRHERDLQYDYEDRIAGLQRQLGRTTSQQSQLQRSLDAKLDALAAQETELRRKTGALTRIAQQVLRLSPRASLAASPTPTVGTASADTSAAGVTAVLPPLDPEDAKPHPQASLEPAPDHAIERMSNRAATVSTAFETLALAQSQELSHLQAAAQDQLSYYRQAFSEAGLGIGRFARKGEDASGGPFVPLEAASAKTPFDRTSLAVDAVMAETEHMKTVVGHVPFAKPLQGTPEVTSPFGVRIDPFLGRPGMHTGIDLREDTGTDVLATAAGRVVFAGPASGYGTMVEIDHGSGLSTRYAHLSAATVSVGETVAINEPVGRVGATGRATGPHLHYETRVDGEPVDPTRFLTAGHHLSVALGAL